MDGNITPPGSWTSKVRPIYSEWLSIPAGLLVPCGHHEMALLLEVGLYAFRMDALLDIGSVVQQDLEELKLGFIAPLEDMCTADPKLPICVDRRLLPALPLGHQALRECQKRFLKVRAEIETCSQTLKALGGSCKERSALNLISASEFEAEGCAQRAKEKSTVSAMQSEMASRISILLNASPKTAHLLASPPPSWPEAIDHLILTAKDDNMDEPSDVEMQSVHQSADLSPDVQVSSSGDSVSIDRTQEEPLAAHRLIVRETPEPINRCEMLGIPIIPFGNDGDCLDENLHASSPDSDDGTSHKSEPLMTDSLPPNSGDTSNILLARRTDSFNSGVDMLEVPDTDIVIDSLPREVSTQIEFPKHRILSFETSTPLIPKPMALLPALSLSQVSCIPDREVPSQATPLKSSSSSQSPDSDEHFKENMIQD